MLRRHTPMSRQWIADRLHMGSAVYVTKLTANPKASIDYENPFDLTPSDPFLTPLRWIGSGLQPCADQG